jgi:hypothetical protein
MKYLCIVFTDKDIAQSQTQEDWERIGRASFDYDVELFRRGAYVLAEALQDPQTAKTVRVRNEEALITDDPFTESKEHIAGFILIEARDEAQAMAIAKDIPMARVGGVEVRPVMVWEKS